MLAEATPSHGVRRAGGQGVGDKDEEVRQDSWKKRRRTAPSPSAVQPLHREPDELLEATTECLLPDVLTQLAECVLMKATQDCVLTEATREVVLTEATTECVLMKATTECVLMEATTERVLPGILTELAEGVLMEATQDCVMAEATREVVLTEATTECVLLKVDAPPALRQLAPFVVDAPPALRQLAPFVVRSSSAALFPPGSC